MRVETLDLPHQVEQSLHKMVHTSFSIHIPTEKHLEILQSTKEAFRAHETANFGNLFTCILANGLKMSHIFLFGGLETKVWYSLIKFHITQSLH